METPVHIDFQGMEPQETLRAEIALQVAALEKRYGRITACRVTVKDPGQHHRTSGLFEVHIHLALPDRMEVNVGQKPEPTNATPMFILRSMMPSNTPGASWRTMFVACRAM